MKKKVVGPARRELQFLAGRKLEVTTTFVRTGTRLVGRRSYKTVLIQDVRDAETGRPLADHLWFNRGNSWRNAGIVPGDRIRFRARSIEYRTGYWGPDPVRRLDEPPRVDFKLTPPEGLAVIHRASSPRVAA